MMITITFKKKKKWDNIYDSKQMIISHTITLFMHFFRLIKSKYQKTIFTLNW